MKAFEIRLAEHHERNARHLRNLQRFTDEGQRFGRLAPDEQKILKRQLVVMAELDEILTLRMKLHNIPV